MSHHHEDIKRTSNRHALTMESDSIPQAAMMPPTKATDLRVALMAWMTGTSRRVISVAVARRSISHASAAVSANDDDGFKVETGGLCSCDKDAAPSEGEDDALSGRGGRQRSRCCSRVRVATTWTGSILDSYRRTMSRSSTTSLVEGHMERVRH